MKNSKYLSGGLVAVLVFSVFVSFGANSGEELMGKLRLKDREVTIQQAPLFENPCWDTDYPGSTPFFPVATTPKPFDPGITYGQKGSNPNTQPWTDYCAGTTLREYHCKYGQNYFGNTAWFVEREDVKCEDKYEGTSCLMDQNGLGYCG